MEINKETKLSQIWDNKEIVKILEKFNLPCLTCPFAQQEIESLKLGQVCDMYNINVEELLKEINKINK